MTEKHSQSLIRRAMLACEGMERIYARAGRGLVTIVDLFNFKGLQAGIVQGLTDQSHDLWLVIPGTGYTFERNELVRDWRVNIRGQLPIRTPIRPGTGEVTTPGIPNRDPVWARGFYQHAMLLHDWLGSTDIEFGVGHSQGAAVLAILAWHRRPGDVKHPVISEAHCIASPGVAFTDPGPCNNVWTWQAREDFVCRTPLFAKPIGNVTILPRVRRFGMDHGCGLYTKRFAQLLGEYNDDNGKRPPVG